MVYKVRAYNDRGWSEYSLENTSGGLMQTKPHLMAPVTRDSATTDIAIIVNWLALSSPENGDSDVIAYNLQWDRGSQGANWYDLYGVLPQETAIQFTLTSDIERSETYLFRIRAANVHGYGLFSVPVLIQAAGIPRQPQVPFTSIDLTTQGLKIQWAVPDNNGAQISFYVVQVQNQAASAFETDLTNCDPQGESTTSCVIPMTRLAQTPFDLQFQQQIVVRVAGVNFYGQGPFSETNQSGETLRQVPSKMNGVNIVTQKEDQISLSWAALVDPNTGNSPILSYNLVFDDATGTVNIPLLDQLFTAYTVTGLTGG